AREVTECSDAQTCVQLPVDRVVECNSRTVMVTPTRYGVRTPFVRLCHNCSIANSYLVVSRATDKVTHAGRTSSNRCVADRATVRHCVPREHRRKHISLR